MADPEYDSKEVWKLAIHISLSSFIYCYAITCMNSCTENIAETLGWGDSFILRSVFTTLFPVGAAIGCMVGAPISSKIGIRKTIIIGNIVFIFASLICVIPSNYTFGAGRFVTGIIGGIFITVPAVFINEITPDPMTGPVGTLIQHACNLGLIFSYLFGLVIPTENLKNNSLNYLWMLILFFPAFPAFYQIYFFLNRFKYENPGWLIKQGRVDEARSALRRIYKESSIELGIKRLNYQGPEGNGSALLNSSPTAREMLCSKKYRKMMRISIAMNMGQQSVGSLVILLYSTGMFESMGGGRLFARGMTLALGVIISVSAGMSIFLFGRFGRKALIMSGTGFISVLWCLLGFINEFVEGAVGLKVFLVFLYFSVFIISLGAVFWTYIGEVCNDKAISIGLTFNFLTTITLSFLFPILSHYFGLSYCFFMFCLLSAVLFIYQTFDLFETKGLTKQEIMDKVMVD